MSPVSREISTLSNNFSDLQAFRCTLKDIAPINGTWSGTPLKTFKLCVEDATLQMLVQEIKTDNILSVSLYKNANPNKNHPISVQTVLIQKGMARGVGELWVQPSISGKFVRAVWIYSFIHSSFLELASNHWKSKPSPEKTNKKIMSMLKMEL